MKRIVFESKSSYEKFCNKTLSNGLFVRENNVKFEDEFLVNDLGDLIELTRTGNKHVILKDDIKYFKAV